MRRTWLCSLLVAAALGLAACGGDDGEEQAATPTPTPTAAEEAGAGEPLALRSPADGALVFEPETLEAPAGRVRIAYTNPSSTPHAVAIDGVEGQSEVITDGETTWTVELEAGEYTYFCPVGNHRQAGMEGTLTVE